MKQIRLKDIAISQTGPFGSQLHEEDYVDKGTPIVTVEHLGDVEFTTQNLPMVSDEDKERLNKYILCEGDIVFSRVGSVDRSTYVKKEQEGWLFSGRCLRVRCDSELVNPRYLSFYFKLDQFKKMMFNLSVGATMPSLNTAIMDNILISLPTIDIQNKIAVFLDNIDEKVSNNNEIAQQLKAMAKTIYDYWFLQFEFPNEEGKPYKSSGGKMVWNEELQREIPEGWEAGSISLLINSKKNGDWGKESMQGNYVLPVSCIRGADLDFVNGKSLSSPPTRFILEKNSSKLLKPYDLIVEISGGSPTQSTGRIAGISSYLFSRFNNGIVCSNFCKAITLKDKVNYHYFLQTWKTLFENDVMFNWEGKTSGIKNLMFDSFVKNTKIPIPNKEQLSTFFDICDRIDNKIQNLLKQNQELLSLRDFLLPLLMNGQVTIGE